MGRSLLLLVTTLLGGAMAPFPGLSASASCAGPSLTATGPLVLERGATSTVEGRGFVDGCQDSMSCSTVGCDSCEYDDPPPAPMQNLRLRIVQDGRSWNVAVADAGTAEGDQLGQVVWTFELPAGVQPGRARLLPERAAPVPVRIR